MAQVLYGQQSWHAQDYLYPHNFGARGDGVTDDTAALTAWLAECDAQGFPGYLPRGTFMVGHLLAQPVYGLEIIGAPGSVIKGIGGEGSEIAVLRVDGLTSRPRFQMRGVTVDNSLRNFVLAGGEESAASGTALQLIRLAHFDVRQCRLISTADYRDEKGDSGISARDYDSCIIEGCYFQGQPDAGIYLNGNDGLTPTDFGDSVVSNNKFYRCALTGTDKRGMRRAHWINNHIVECRAGIANFGSETLAGDPTYPGLDMIISGNWFHRCQARAIYAKAGPIIATNNIIEDWGYTPEGEEPLDHNFDYAVFWMARGSQFKNNILRFRNWSGAAMIGVRLASDEPEEPGALPYDNWIDGNTFEGCEIGIQERDPVVGPNFGRNHFVGVTTPVELPASGLSRSRFEMVE